MGDREYKGFYESFITHLMERELPAAVAEAAGTNDPRLFNRREAQLRGRKEELKQAYEHFFGPVSSSPTTPSRSASAAPSRSASGVSAASSRSASSASAAPSRSASGATAAPSRSASAAPSRSASGASNMTAGTPSWMGGKKTRKLRRKNKVVKALQNTRLRRAHRVK